jgi:hypothetical protein
MKSLPQELVEISTYLKVHNTTTIDDSIEKILVQKKREYVLKNQDDNAKIIWILETIFKIKKFYINAFNKLVQKDYRSAWRKFDMSDIQLSFLLRHFDISNNEYNLLFISNQIRYFQKLFPYFLFTSRESIIKKRVCSICKKEIKIRHKCEHKKGEIYDGEMCHYIIKDVELLGISFVRNPFDKYAVVLPADKEYNYRGLEQLMKVLKNPYEKWKIETIKEKKEEFKQINRNDFCPCGSGLKYNKCCLVTGNNLFDHHQIIFLERTSEINSPLEIINTWK